MRRKRILKNTRKKQTTSLTVVNTLILGDSMINNDKKAYGNKEVPSDWDQFLQRTK